jgi:P-type conjugative transfer protein TrbJ
MAAITSQQIAIGGQIQSQDQLYQRLYPQQWSAQTLDQYQIYRDQWQQYAQANQARLNQTIQQIEQDAPGDADSLNQALQDSQSAEGPTAASQAANQIAALNVKQTTQLSQLMRAQVEEQQRAAATQDATRAAADAWAQRQWQDSRLPQ